MKILKSIMVLIGIVLICGGGWMAWRSAHPALTDAEQVEANLTAISQAAARHSSQGILNYLADGFSWNDHNRHDVASMLSGAMFELNEVRIDTNSVSVQIQGNTAVSTGNYLVTAQERQNDTPKTYAGKFRVEWKKQRGQWLATKASSEGQSPI
jgi:predicted HicB family RNase H-like nuclease